MIDIKDVQVGKSYACRFRDGLYEGLGILILRDVDQQLVKLRDERSNEEYIVSFDNIWDIDEIEWTDGQD